MTDYDYYKYYKLKIKKEVYLENGYSGIINFGNKCFATSILHCLANTLSLTDYFLSGDFKEDIHCDKTINITVQYRNVIKKMYDYNQLIKLTPFYNTLCEYYNKYKSLEQQDSHEFLIILLDLLHKSLCYKVLFKRNFEQETSNFLLKKATDSWESFFKKDYSIIIKLFYGNIVKRVKCIQCKIEDYKFEHFNYIPVYTCNENRHLLESLEFTNEEVVTKNCKCGNSNHTVFANLWTLPNYLIFVIKRFDETSLKKNNSIINFPINNLDLTHLIHKDKHKSKCIYLYDLYAVNYHTGNVNSGHYYSVIKNVISNEWYTYNDGNILKHPSFIVENALVNEHAYILFYHRKFTR